MLLDTTWSSTGVESIWGSPNVLQSLFVELCAVCLGYCKSIFSLTWSELNTDWVCVQPTDLDFSGEISFLFGVNSWIHSLTPFYRLVKHLPWCYGGVYTQSLGSSGIFALEVIAYTYRFYSMHCWNISYHQLFLKHEQISSNCHFYRLLFSSFYFECNCNLVSRAPIC